MILCVKQNYKSLSNNDFWKSNTLHQKLISKQQSCTKKAAIIVVNFDHGFSKNFRALTLYPCCLMVLIITCQGGMELIFHANGE